MFQATVQSSQAGALQDLATLEAEFVADGYVVHLFTSGFNPTPENVHADFAAVEATFTGYAAQTIGGTGHLFIGPYINNAGLAVLITPEMVFEATDDVSPNQIGGFWIEDTAMAVRRYGVFPFPVPMTTALSFLNLTVYESSQGQGYAEVSN